MSEIEVRKVAASVPVTDEVLADAVEHRAAYDWWMTASPDERARWAREASDRRASERAAVPRVELTMAALLDKIGWSREYAEHVVQPYCSCWDGMDGWEYCQHARDEDLA